MFIYNLKKLTILTLSLSIYSCNNEASKSTSKSIYSGDATMNNMMPDPLMDSNTIYYNENKPTSALQDPNAIAYVPQQNNQFQSDTPLPPEILNLAPEIGIEVAGGFSYEERFAACQKEFLYEDDRIVKAYGGNRRFCDIACGSMIPKYSVGNTFRCISKS